MQQKIDWSAISPDESEKLKDELVEMWEASVRSTHHFLAEKDIRFFKPLVRDKYIPVVELYTIRNEQNRIAAFMGLSDELIEMLFVHPEEQGKGYGKQLIEFAIYIKYSLTELYPPSKAILQLLNIASSVIFLFITSIFYSRPFHRS